LLGLRNVVIAGRGFVPLMAKLSVLVVWHISKSARAIAPIVEPILATSPPFLKFLNWAALVARVK
jgi:hypothetical protein